MYLVNPGPRGTSGYWRCLVCPDGLIGGKLNEDAATQHTEQTGHGTEYGQIEWQLLHGLRTEVEQDQAQSGLGWPAQLPSSTLAAQAGGTDG